MILSKQQAKFSKDVAKLINYATKIGVDLTFGEAYRTEFQEAEYVRTGKSKTMKSNHLRRLAVDFNFFIDGKLFWKHEKIDELGKYWETLSVYNRWGGHFHNFKDRPHFERNI